MNNIAQKTKILYTNHNENPTYQNHKHIRTINRVSEKSKNQIPKQEIFFF